MVNRFNEYNSLYFTFIVILVVTTVALLCASQPVATSPGTLIQRIANCRLVLVGQSCPQQ